MLVMAFSEHEDFIFFWGRMPPEIPSDSHLWNKNDFEAIQKHPEFTSSKGWTV